MGAPQFTRGPWSVGPPHVVRQQTTDEHGRRVTRFVAEAVLSAPFEEGEREANASLIAAAPDGYEAAGAFIMAAINEWDIPEGRRTDEGWLSDTLGHALAGAFLKAMAFRAKARGEA